MAFLVSSREWLGLGFLGVLKGQLPSRASEHTEVAVRQALLTQGRASSWDIGSAPAGILLRCC